MAKIHSFYSVKLYRRLCQKKPLVQLNFLEISFRSFKESKYLLYFSNKQKFITQDDYVMGLKLAEEIRKMLWKELIDLENSSRK